jgi:hypothetical protein
VSIDDASALVSLLDKLGAGEAAKDPQCPIGDAELAKFREETGKIHQRLKALINVRSLACSGMIRLRAWSRLLSTRLCYRNLPPRAAVPFAD